jgi:hypothetical protein
MHTLGVVVVNETARRDDAVALTVSGDCGSVFAPGFVNVIDWEVRFTVKVRDFCGARAYRLSPGWSARTVQEPGATSVIVAPFGPPAVQTAGVEVVTVTGRFDDAVADTVTGDWTIVSLEIAASVTVWVAKVTVKGRGRSGAALYVASPPCDATIVQVPAVRSVTVDPRGPLVVHTGGVLEAKVTGRFDDAVADTVNGDCTSVRLAIVPNEIV